MLLKGRDTHADRPRNELEKEEETVQTLHYSQDQAHHSGTAARPGPNGEDGEFGSVEEDGDEDAGRPPTIFHVHDLVLQQRISRTHEVMQADACRNNLLDSADLPWQSRQ